MVSTTFWGKINSLWNICIHKINSYNRFRKEEQLLNIQIVSRVNNEDCLVNILWFWNFLNQKNLKYFLECKSTG